MAKFRSVKIFSIGYQCNHKNVFKKKELLKQLPSKFYLKQKFDDFDCETKKLKSLKLKKNNYNILVYN